MRPGELTRRIPGGGGGAGKGETTFWAQRGADFHGEKKGSANRGVGGSRGVTKSPRRGARTVFNSLKLGLEVKGRLG